MEKLFLGINGYVVCLKKNTGEELWRTKLKSSTIVNVYSDERRVFAHAGGHLFCLNIADGSLVWENPLKGLGYGTCIIASEVQNSAVVANQVAAQQAAAAVGTTAAVSAGSAS